MWGATVSGLVHYDGSAWTLVEPVDGIESIHGVASNDVYAVQTYNSEGTVLHWDGGAWDWRINLAGVHASLDEIIGFPEVAGAYGGPTLFVAGELSNYIRAEYTDTTNRLFPNVRTATIPGAGHWVHADRPGAFIETVREFLGAE